MQNPHEHAEVADRLAIMELSGRYMRGLDRLDADAFRGLFWDDAHLEYGIYSGGPAEFIAFCLEALKSHGANQHMLGQIIIDFDEAEPDTAFGEVYYQAYHRTQDDSGSDRDLFISGRYVDRYERRGGRWAIAYRSELVDWTRDDPASDQWFAGSAMIRGARKPDDPLYDRAAMR
ncbi:MAG: nuclear transport factor 2 family protein [Pseudomonadota bacterium]